MYFRLFSFSLHKSKKYFWKENILEHPSVTWLGIKGKSIANRGSGELLQRADWPRTSDGQRQGCIPILHPPSFCVSTQYSQACKHRQLERTGSPAPYLNASVSDHPLGCCRFKASPKVQYLKWEKGTLLTDEVQGELVSSEGYFLDFQDEDLWLWSPEAWAQGPLMEAVCAPSSSTYLHVHR